MLRASLLRINSMNSGFFSSLQKAIQNGLSFKQVENQWVWKCFKVDIGY